MPLFDLDNAVQQGFNRDPSNNDWNVEARNLEIVLEDNVGTGEFRIHDSDNVAVIVGDSDGYFSVRGNAEVHGGNILVEGPDAANTNTEFVTLRDTVDEASLFLADADPDGSVAGTKGSLALNYTDGYLHINIDDATDWDRFPTLTEVNSIVNTGLDTITLQRAYDNDPDGGDAIIVTNATDGAVVIAGTEKLQVTATGGFDLDTGFDMDGSGPFDVDITGAVSIDADAASNFSVSGANLTLETVTSGDVLVNLPGTAGDFFLSDGTSDYIRTVTSVNEVRLGDASTPVITRVMDDLYVDGDLHVDGYETILNTEELFIEDRMMRINTGAPDGFTGTTGFEAYLGLDGYAEFHWDDTQDRWEISIDNSTTSGAQTFRPLPYLADNAATLDLSSTGTGGYPTAGPNPDAGASVINTDATNFPYTFGPDMTDNSVQAALEAIDGYFQEITDAIVGTQTFTTLQIAYDNDVDGGDATITTNATDGSVVIAGTESFRVTATGGIDLDSGFDMDATSAFDVLLTGAAFSLDSDTASNVTVTGADLTLSTVTSGNVVVSSAGDIDADATNILLDATSGISLDAGAASNFTTTAGALTLDGAGGIILDGNGNDVRPAVSCLDTLGTSTFGWADAYLCNHAHGDIVVGLADIGGTTAHNTTAGADLVGTNSDVFFATFGPDMTEDTVQGALEAIDGYLQELTVGFTTVSLQVAYENGNTIDTSAAFGNVIISGTETVNITTAGGLDLDTGFDMDGAGPFDVDITGAVSIDADAYSNFLVQDAGLVIGTVGDAGVLDLIGQGGIVLDGTGDNVIPADSCTDSLGDATHGWTTIWLCNGNNIPVALNGAGGAATPNNTSGAFVVGTDADNFATFGPDMTSDTVQAALEAIDGYLQNLSVDDLVDSTFIQCRGLDIDGGIKNGNVKINNVSGMATLDYKAGKTNRTQWTIPVPADWDGVSDIDIEVIWSPDSTNTGNVEWRLEYKSLTLTELASTAVTTVDYTQAAGGTIDAIQSTETNLSIAAGDISTADDVIAINIVRRGTVAGDTFTDDAQVHLVKYCYTAENIVA